MMKIKRGSNAYIAATLFFLYAPIGVLIFFSFNKSKSRNLFTGFTLDWYRQLFHNEMVLRALGLTMTIALIASVCATILGTAAAVGIQSLNRLPRLTVMNVTYTPVINPEIVTGVSMLLLFTALRFFLRFEMGFGTLLAAHITFNVPYVILSVNPKLRQLDKSLYEAALDLGCFPMRAFFTVVIPQIMPGIMTGFLMSLTYSIDDFVISYFTAGKSQTLSITIYAMTRRKVSPEINALSTLLFVLVSAILLLVNIKDIKTPKKRRVVE
ncbi:MAG: ABC transporter permease [Oscillospiraceae bacterium]|nr:ABC transporter permease [Oscillospiraceae bacterium]